MRLWPSFSARSAEGQGGWQHTRGPCRGRAGLQREPEPGCGSGWDPPTFQDLSQRRLGFVDGRLAVFVGNADQGPVAHQVLKEGKGSICGSAAPSQPLPAHPASCLVPPRVPSAPSLGSCPLPSASAHLGHLVVAPEAGVVQRRVPVLVHGVDVCFELHQLGAGGRSPLTQSGSPPPPAPRAAVGRGLSTDAGHSWGCWRCPGCSNVTARKPQATVGSESRADRAGGLHGVPLRLPWGWAGHGGAAGGQVPSARCRGGRGWQPGAGGCRPRGSSR